MTADKPVNQSVAGAPPASPLPMDLRRDPDYLRDRIKRFALDLPSLTNGEVLDRLSWLATDHLLTAR